MKSDSCRILFSGAQGMSPFFAIDLFAYFYNVKVVDIDTDQIDKYSTTSFCFKNHQIIANAISEPLFYREKTINSLLENCFINFIVLPNSKFGSEYYVENVTYFYNSSVDRSIKCVLLINNPPISNRENEYDEQDLIKLYNHLDMEVIFSILTPSNFKRNQDIFLRLNNCMETALDIFTKSQVNRKTT